MLSLRHRIKRLQIFCVFISAFTAFLATTAKAKPTLTFSLTQNFPSLMTLTQQFVDKRSYNQIKEYTGQRLRNDSLIMIYFHDQTIAVVELGNDKILLNCELIEIYKDDEGKQVLNQMAAINRPMKISFKEMLKLMNQCDLIDRTDATRLERQQKNLQTNDGFLSQNPFSILSGIIPGTKWCGTGDIAVNYYDLGSDERMDRCCRTHDLCPKKVRAFQSRYNLINNSIYTKSHCNCDDMLYSCLKKLNTSASQLMGTIYFDIVKVPCLKEDSGALKYRQPKQF